MITALALNPSIDMTVSVGEFVYGGLNRAKTARSDAGGKGMNVALALRALDCEAECVGFMHEDNAVMFENKLKERGAAYDFIYCPGGTRTNIKLRDDSAGVITEINQFGRAVTPAQLQNMLDMIRDHAKRADYMVLSGSVPPGCGPDIYREIIGIARDHGCRCVLDADGEKLARGLEAKPFLIKPNRYELELLTGRSLPGKGELLGAARGLIDGGVEVVAVSLGGEGALITDGKESLFAPALKIDVNSTVGAGDSMVAGLTAAFSRGMSLANAFRAGIACASAACMTEGTQTFSRAEFERLYAMVEIENV